MKAEVDLLSQDKQWLAMLHYPTPSFFKRRSRIVNSSFFIHPDGNVNPLKELHATIKALNTRPENIDGLHPRCKYPARFMWLKQKLGDDTFLSLDVRCEKLEEWRKVIRRPNIRLVFVGGSFGNPASMFGHILLPLDGSHSNDSVSLRSEAINFGADVPENENPFLYLIKGFSGGYISKFSSAKFFFYNHDYLIGESRDLWLYKLNLNKFDTTLLINHIWELRNAEFRYFFLHQNCATEMQALLSVTSIAPSKPFRFWYSPQDLIHGLAEVDILTVEHRLGLESRLHKAYKKLQSVERRVLRKILKDSSKINHYFSEHSLSVAEKIKILDTAIIYAEQLNKKGTKNEYNILKQKLFVARLALPRSTSSISSTTKEHIYRRSRIAMIQTGIIQTDVSHPVPFFRIRPAYQDFLTAGIPPEDRMNFSILDTRLTIKNRRVKFQSIDFFRVDSLGLRSTRLIKNKVPAWSIGLGRYESNGDLKTNFMTGLGLSKMIAKNAFFIKGYSEFKYGQDKFEPYIGSEIGTAIRLSAFFDSINRVYFLFDQKRRLYRNLDLQIRLGNHKSWDIRYSFAWKYNQQENILALSKYW